MLICIKLEAEPMSHNNLLKQGRVKVDWSRCQVRDHVSIMCYNCIAVGQYAKDCKDTVAVR